MILSSHSGPAERIQVLERGWLSSNSVLLQGRYGTALVDSGYGLHAAQTLSLVQNALQGRALDTLVNTHLHSDHCGGNAVLQLAWPRMRTLIPPGQAQAVRDWDEDALSYTPTGQTCARFGFDALLEPGTSLALGDALWQVHAAPGHDPHSVVLFEPHSRTLISADALWERGFGVVFPELEGVGAFDAVAQTLDVIAALQPTWVIPGHGAPFGGGPEGAATVEAAIGYARQRLHGFVSAPQRHRQYAAKVLVKFRLLEAQQMDMQQLGRWADRTPYLVQLLRQLERDRWGDSPNIPHGPDTLDGLVQDLVRAGAARVVGDVVYNL